MNIRRALTFLFRDPRWVGKLGVATVLNLPHAALFGYGLIAGGSPAPPLLAGAAAATPQSIAAGLLWAAFVGLMTVPLYGFVLRITRNVVVGHDRPLPAWSDVGDLLRSGLRLWGVITLWGLPVALARFAASAVTQENGDGGAPAFDAVIVVVSLLVFVLQPAAEARLAVTGSLAAGLDVPAAFATVRRNLGGYLRLLMIFIVGSALVIGLSSGVVWLAWTAIGGQPGLRELIAVGLAVYAATLGPYSLFVIYHLTGQAYAGATDGAVSRRNRRAASA